MRSTSSPARSSARRLRTALCPWAFTWKGHFSPMQSEEFIPPLCLRGRRSLFFERFWQASRGHIRLMTIAPELDHALELIEYASALGVRCSLGHSDATASRSGGRFSRRGALGNAHFQCHAPYWPSRSGSGRVCARQRRSLCGNHLRWHPCGSSDDPHLLQGEGSRTVHLGHRWHRRHRHARREYIGWAPLTSM